jgi:uncharacterized membrane protein/protein-disulfide isomerase
MSTPSIHGSFTSRARLAVIGFTLLGLGASLTSAVVHYRLLRDPFYTSFCDFNASVSCTDAYRSAWGALFGVPVALLGVLWFVGVAALLVAERGARRAVADNVPGYVLAASAVGLAFVLYLAYGAFFVLKAVCVLCLLTYVAVLGIFLVSASSTRVPMTTLPARALRDLRAAASSPLALTAFVLLAAGAASAIAFFPREVPAAVATSGETAAQAAPAAPMPEAQRSEVERWFDSQPRAIVPVDGGGAAVLIVKFNDYQCPPCRRTHEEYKPILARYEKQYPGRVKHVTKDYPLDPECNANTPQGGHLAACEAAVAVRLARERGEAVASKLEDWIFTNQATLTPMSVKQAARDIAGIQDFDGRYAGVLAQVKSDTALGSLLGVRATPTFFINGVKIDGGLQAPFFDAILGYELRKASAK